MRFPVDRVDLKRLFVFLSIAFWKEIIITIYKPEMILYQNII